MSFARRSDLDLQADASGRFLPWMVAVMSFLAVLALAGALLLEQAVGRWSRGVSGALTVQVSDSRGPDGEQRLAAAMEVLRRTPGVASAVPLAPQEVDRLLEPWLGTATLPAELPVPALIEVRTEPGLAIDQRSLGERLGSEVPGTTLDAHESWLAPLVELARAMEALAAAIIGLVGAAMVAVVIFATRTGLQAHASVIEVLHLIGAQDTYIAAQFQRHAGRLALLGAALGAGLAGLVLVAIAWLGARLEAPLLPQPELGLFHLLLLFAVPAAAWLLALLTARVTVLRTLGRLP